MNIIIPDCSFYQFGWVDNTYKTILRYINFDLMWTKTHAVIVRAGQNLWKDPAFDVSWKFSKFNGLFRGSYWFFDSRVPPKQQAQLWISILGSDRGELPLFADFEERYNGPWGGWKNWKIFLEEVKRLAPEKEVFIYTNYYYWREFTIGKSIPTADLEYFKQYPLWIAGYKTSVPLIPKPWTEWTLWQFTAEGDGASYGVASAEIDLNYFNGDQAAFNARFGLDAVHVGSKSLRANMSDGTQIMFEKRGD